MKRRARSVIATPVRHTFGFWRGLGYPFVGMHFVYRKHPELFRYWVFPIAITFVALVAAVWVAIHYQPEVAQYLWAHLPATVQNSETWWGSGLRWIVGAGVSLASVAISVVGVIALSSVFAAPFNDALSEAVEGIVSQTQSRGFSLSAVGRDVRRAVMIEILKLAFYAFTIVPLFLASFALPLVGQVMSVFAFILTCVFLAVDYIDWPAARRDIPVRTRLAFVGRNLGALIGFGLGTWVLLFVPLLNLFFMPAAVAGATLLYLKIES